MLNRKEFIIYLTIFLTVLAGVFLFLPASAKQENKDTVKNVSSEENKDISGIMKALEDRERELVKREDALKREEDRINILKNTVDLSIKQYSTMRERIQKELASNNGNGTNGAGNGKSSQGIGNIVKIYEAMTPSDAARRIEKLDSGMAVELLSKIKSKHAGKIMEAMSAEKSVLLTEKIAALK
ncbi:MAG: hypothetical protein HZA08_03140 [Nitrospirae bacterium]|nr:hypothetical protein [Nitrospirota bacterium]